MPHVEIVYKHNAAARRLSIRGHNGKVRYYWCLLNVLHLFFCLQHCFICIFDFCGFFACGWWIGVQW